MGSLGIGCCHTILHGRKRRAAVWTAAVHNYAGSVNGYDLSAACDLDTGELVHNVAGCVGCYDCFFCPDPFSQQH